MTTSVCIKACTEKDVRVTKVEPNTQHQNCKLETTIVKRGSEITLFVWGNQSLTIEEIT